VLVTPWLAFNVSHYHSLTANFVAKEMQQPLINPTNHKYTVSDVPHTTSEYVRDFFLPNEWTPLTVLVRPVKDSAWGMAVLLFLVPTAFCVVRPSAVGAENVLLLGLPFVVDLAFVELTSITSSWPSSGRYLYGAAAGWMAFAFVATSRVLRSGAVVLMVLLGMAGVGYLWVEALRYF
jgi:hypothetical protein